jgi:hypothetical protein
MTPDIYPDDDPKRGHLFRHGWERVLFFAGLAICLMVVLLGQYLWV